MFKRLFSDQDFRPDQLKIYPCQVLKGSELKKIYERGDYEPYSEEQIVDLLIKLKQIVPHYCRIMRIMREIPPSYLIAGTRHIDLRKTLKEMMKEHNKKCRCIRCREIGFVERDSKKEIDKNLKLDCKVYSASEGREIFLQFVNKDEVIFALLRLRIPNKSKTLIVRELHTFGKQMKLGEAGKKNAQHKGLGHKLMKEVEKIAKVEKCSEIKIISGVGVREYYKKLGYSLKDEYMVKEI
jgi:elongator complex protein 3